MKSIRILVIAMFLGAASAFAAEGQASTAPVTPEKPGCCKRAEKKGKTCENACCVAAAKEGKVCEKCLKKGHGKKKKGEHKDHEQPEAPAATKAAQ